MNMTVQDFISVDPNSLSPSDLAEVSEAYLLGLVPCEYCSSFTQSRHEWHEYLTGSLEECPSCEKRHEAMFLRLLRSWANPPWSNMNMIWLHYRIVSVGLQRILRRHLVRMAFEDYFECQRLVRKWFLTKPVFVIKKAPETSIGLPTTTV